MVTEETTTEEEWNTDRAGTNIAANVGSLVSMYWAGCCSGRYCCSLMYDPGICKGQRQLSPIDLKASVCPRYFSIRSDTFVAMNPSEPYRHQL
jgi:hypothetical protein